jgi:hypothetical protein
MCVGGRCSGEDSALVICFSRHSSGQPPPSQLVPSLGVVAKHSGPLTQVSDSAQIQRAGMTMRGDHSAAFEVGFLLWKAVLCRSHQRRAPSPEP